MLEASLFHYFHKNGREVLFLIEFLLGLPLASRVLELPHRCSDEAMERVFSFKFVFIKVLVVV